MAQSSAQKLGIKAGNSVVATGHPSLVVAELVGELPDGATLAASGESPDVALLFAETVQDVVSRAPATWASVADGGRLWVCYRKGASKRQADGAPVLHRDTLQAALAEVGLDGVTLVSLDDTWSAMRVKAVTA